MKVLPGAVGILVFISCAYPTFAQTYYVAQDPIIANFEAYAAFKMANYEEARQTWEKLASDGNSESLFNLGVLAEDGLGEPPNIMKAESLYIASANAGGYKAQYRLGLLYSTDKPLRKDLALARHYYSLAAAQGDKEAANRLAALNKPFLPVSRFEQAEFMSSQGRHKEAAKLYQHEADRGNMVALTRLAWMYESGRGVAHDLEKAANYFLIAAKSGVAEAQYALGVMYRTGKGLTKNTNLGLQWLQRAADQKYPPALAAVKSVTFSIEKNE